MTYNPQIHHRRSIRLRGYDYSQAGAYFITICVQNRKCLFGDIVGAGFTPALNDRATEMVAPTMVVPTMELNDFGIIAYQQWQKLPERFTNMELDVFQIMPNHMHGIIVITNSVHDKSIADETKTVGDIVGAYKSLVANECLEIFKQKYPDELMGKLWQRNYHEHIIRDEQSYQRISKYIINNPKNWKEDKFYND